MCVCVVAYLPRGDMIVEAQRVCYEWRERGGLCVVCGVRCEVRVVCVRVCVWCVCVV